MSESTKNKKLAPFSRIILFVTMIAIFVVMLGLGYAGGYFLLPSMIKSAYQNKDCESVLSRNNIYTSIYPPGLSDKEVTGVARECAVYILATRNEETKKWHDSYNAYRVYSDSYPNGLFIGDAHEHSAVVLINLVREEISQKKYPAARENIDTLLEDYADTAVALDAEQLRSDIHMESSADLREIGDFAGAERVFREINVWAQTVGRPEYVRASQLELAQTYLAWGLALQAQEKFAEAKVKFDTAMSTDPEPSFPSGPAAQAKAGQVELFTQWGDYLIQKKDFANAMDLFEIAETLSNDNGTAPNDIVANGFMLWAEDAIVGEDFLGALVLLDFAQERAATDSTKTMVEDARSDLYLAFSKSNGEQALQAINQAVRIVCEHHIQPSLPIFGLDQENIRVSVYGVDGQLPESLVATTPDSLHYVACIDKDTRIVQSLKISVNSQQIDPNSPPRVVQVEYHRIKNIWNVVLRKIDTGNEVNMTVMEGGEPPSLSLGNANMSSQNWYGPEPDFTDLIDWLLIIIQ